MADIKTLIDFRSVAELLLEEKCCLYAPEVLKSLLPALVLFLDYASASSLNSLYRRGRKR